MLILERALTATVNGQDRPVPVRFYLPQFIAEGEWRCRFEIHWPDGPGGREVPGIDGVQSLQLAMQVAALQLYESDLHGAGALRWLAPADGYGLPLPLPVREWHIGMDKAL